MTDKKFTDEEVIKALECCAKPYCNNNNCPLHENTINTKDCITKLSENALALINRQRAEIERLHSEVKENTETIAFLKDQAVGWSIDFCNLKAKLDTTKSEAVKEFEERLKNDSCKIIECNGITERVVSYQISPEGVDKIVKELTNENRSGN